MQLSNVRPIVDPEVQSFLRIVDWHLSIGPRNISRWHPLLDERVFISSHTSSSSSSLHSPMSILIHVYTPGRRLPPPHTSRLSIRVYQHARVRDLFYEISDCLGAVVEADTLASLSRGEQRKIDAAQRWRIWQGFTEIGTTSVRSAGEDAPIVFADFLDGDFVLSDLTPVYATDGSLSLSVLFKASSD